MARRSLSSQVIEELDRANGLLRSVADSVDPIIGHLLGAVQDSHQRIQDMCLAARTSPADALLNVSPSGEYFQPPTVAPGAPKRRTSHKAGGTK